MNKAVALLLSILLAAGINMRLPEDGYAGTAHAEAAFFTMGTIHPAAASVTAEAGPESDPGGEPADGIPKDSEIGGMPGNQKPEKSS